MIKIDLSAFSATEIWKLRADLSKVSRISPVLNDCQIHPETFRTYLVLLSSVASLRRCQFEGDKKNIALYEDLLQDLRRRLAAEKIFIKV